MTARGVPSHSIYHGWRSCWFDHGAPWSSIGQNPPAGWDATEQFKRLERSLPGRLRRLGVIQISAAQLLIDHAVTMSLDDGGGVGWVLVGEVHVESVGRIRVPKAVQTLTIRELRFTAPPTRPDAIERVLSALNLTPGDLIQAFD